MIHQLNILLCIAQFHNLRGKIVSTFTSGGNQNQNCKFHRGHLVMSMRQGRGGDLCNRGDPPSNMTCHRYQPSPNIKWTRLPFSHKMCTRAKNLLLIRVCLSAPVGFERQTRGNLCRRGLLERLKGGGSRWLPLVNGGLQTSNGR